MGVAYNPAIVTSGLVLCLDAGNPKGYDKYENLITDSEFSYIQLSGNTTATSGQNFVPYGRNTAVNFVNNGGAGNTYIYRNFNTSLAIGTKYVLSVFSNTSTLSYNQGGISSGQYSLVSSGVTSISGGWYRHWRVYSATVNNPSITPQVTISSGQNITLSGWQMELGEVMNDYYRTFGSTKTRGTTWTDLSGNGNNGTLVNGAGYSNGALVFDGTNDYVTINQTLSTPFTITGFVRYTDQAKTLNMYMNTTPHTVLGISLNRLGGGQLYVYIGNGSSWVGAPAIISSSNMLVNTWYQVTFTSTGSGSTLYLNGNSVGTSIYSPSGWGSTYYLGAGFTGSFIEHLKGNISTTQIYNRALTAAEIQQNFNASRSRFGL